MIRIRRSSAALWLLAPVSIVLSACGFQPLYGTSGVGSSLSAIEVVSPQGRTAFLLKEQLEDQLARDRETPPRYRLVFHVEQDRVARGLRTNNIALRYDIRLDIRYTLTDIVAGKTVLEGRVRPVSGYDSAGPPYAGVIAEQSGEERVATLGAVQIRLDLSRYFVRVRP